jgi:hypothetical protein
LLLERGMKGKVFARMYVKVAQSCVGCTGGSMCADYLKTFTLNRIRYAQDSTTLQVLIWVNV